MSLIRSWVDAANQAECPFPLNNLPYGVFSKWGGPARCGVAIGDQVFDLTMAEADGIVSVAPAPFFQAPSWNAFMASGPENWKRLRAVLMDQFVEGATNQTTLSRYLTPLADVDLHLPFQVSEYTDFYAGRHHATNVGTMFRGAENALPPNWLHMPIGYNGRASSVIVSGTDIRRPWGQIKGPNEDAPRFAPSARFDIELELGAVVGTASDRPVTVNDADAMIFGYVLLNDWSARDIQAWEYQPLGPFQGKATATSISPWIVTQAALDPFRCDTPPREVPLLDHLKDTGPMLYDIDLAVDLNGDTIAQTNYREMYYSAAQQLAHHSSSGCPMNTGDLLGSGTISGPEKHQRGSLLELSWGGAEPFGLSDGTTRSFLNDGDTVTLHGSAKGDGFQIGFGTCCGTILPAHDDPYKKD